MPVFAVLVEALAKLAVACAIGLHELAMVGGGAEHQGAWLIRTHLAAVREAAAHGLAAREGGAGHLLTVHLSCRALGREGQGGNNGQWR